jgi:hypothetical protein
MATLGAATRVPAAATAGQAWVGGGERGAGQPQGRRPWNGAGMGLGRRPRAGGDAGLGRSTCGLAAATSGRSRQGPADRGAWQPPTRDGVLATEQAGVSGGHVRGEQPAAGGGEKRQRLDEEENCRLKLLLTRFAKKKSSS